MYFCAFGLLIAIPLAYIACQILTWVVYEGRWRKLCLLPILPFVLAFTPLFFLHSDLWIFIICMGAPAVGMIALSMVWASYTKSKELEAEQQSDGLAEGD